MSVGWKDHDVGAAYFTGVAMGAALSAAVLAVAGVGEPQVITLALAGVTALLAGFESRRGESS